MYQRDICTNVNYTDYNKRQRTKIPSNGPCMPSCNLHIVEKDAREADGSKWAEFAQTSLENRIEFEKFNRNKTQFLNEDDNESAVAIYTVRMRYHHSYQLRFFFLCFF